MRRIDRTDRGWALALDAGSLSAAHAVIATGSDAEPILPSWPGLESFEGTVMHAGRFRNVAEFAGLDVLVVGPGNSGVDLTDGVTIAVDDGFARALKAGRVVMKPGIDRFDGTLVRFTDGTRPGSWPGLFRSCRPADVPPLSARTCRRRRPA